MHAHYTPYTEIPQVQGSPHTQAYLQREGKTQAVVRGRGEGGGSRPHKTAKMGDKADKGDKGDKATSSPTIPSPPPLPSPVFELITAFDAPNLRKGNGKDRHVPVLTRYRTNTYMLY